MAIRDRTADDLPACVAALHEVHLGDNYPTRWPDDAAAWLTPDGLQQAWVAEHDGAIVGHIGIQAGWGEPGLAAATGVPIESLALVARLYVTPAGRGLGLARTLVEVAHTRAAGLGLRVGLDVMEVSQAAIALYESLGWEHRGSEPARWRALIGTFPLIRYYLAPA